MAPRSWSEDRYRGRGGGAVGEEHGRGGGAVREEHGRQDRHDRDAPRSDRHQGPDKYAPRSDRRQGSDKHAYDARDDRDGGRRDDGRREERRSRSRRSRSDRGRRPTYGVREEPRRDEPRRDEPRRARSRGGRDGGYRKKDGGRRRKDGGRRKSYSERRRSPTPLSQTSSTTYSDSSSDSRRSSPSAPPKKKKADNSGDSDKDEIVHFSWRKGMVMNNRYHIVRLLGDGTFGRVLLAQDQRDNRQVAIKIIRDVKRYAENAKIEADILKDIRKRDPHGEASRSCIMYDTFGHNRHYCLVFEPCGVSLYDFLKKNSFRGFLVEDIQTFMRECLEAMCFLHGQLRMTHTDLKLENILLETREAPRPCAFPREGFWREEQRRSNSSGGRPSAEYLRPAQPHIRIIDFGNATYEDEHHSSCINTRQYRSPEVILGLGWNQISDIWSLGAIFMELYTGELLFGTHENLEHLALMEKLLEPMPANMLGGAKKDVREKYVTQDPQRQLRLNWPERCQPPSSERHVKEQRPIGHLAPREHGPLTDFCGSLLTLDPAKRLSAKEALEHPFLDARVPE